MRKPKQTHGLTNLGTGPRNRGRIPHADDFAVDDFAHVMKGKLAQKRDEGRGGWENKEGCSAEFLSQLLREHVEKGDPIDVANFCMMLHQRGERIAATQPASTALVERLTKALEKCQKALAAMIDPSCIAQTTVVNAFAMATEAEASARSALSASQSTSRKGESR